MPSRVSSVLFSGSRRKENFTTKKIERQLFPSLVTRCRERRIESTKWTRTLADKLSGGNKLDRDLRRDLRGFVEEFLIKGSVAAIKYYTVVSGQEKF